MRFEDLGLDPALVKAVAEQGYTTPSPIQAQAIPPILEGRDVMAAAQTGTGKTAGFTLPILHRLAAGKRAGGNQARALILTPTRELAAQVNDNVRDYSAHLPLTSAVVFGGVKINPQMMRLRRGVDVLVATPGRLLDLCAQNAIKFNQLEVLVLDEADRMLDMGFIHDIRKILAMLPKKRQTLMFSATFSSEIRELAKTLVQNPVQVSVAPSNSAVPLVTQLIHPVDKAKKASLLIHLIKQDDWQQALVFSRTKHGADRIAKQLQAAKISAVAIHGDKNQGERTRALAEFKQGKVRILVATDIAARGLDIDQLPQVANFDLPNVPEDYVHRIGRTGRAGAKGQAVSLVSADEIQQLIDIERLIGKTIERDSVWGFEPVHDVPASPNPRAHKPKTSARPKSRGPRKDSARGTGGQQPPGANKSSTNKSGTNNSSTNRRATKPAEGRGESKPRGAGRSAKSRSR